MKVEGLKFEPPILSQTANVGTDAHIVSIDIEAAFNEHVAEPEVVRLHRRMIAAFESSLVPRTQRTTDEGSGSAFVE